MLPLLLVLPLLLLLLLLQYPSRDRNFELFKAQFGRQYADSEEQYRRMVFRNNLKIIEEHNRKGGSWKMGVNQFADLTQGEFVTQMLGTYPSQRKPSYNISLEAPANEW